MTPKHSITYTYPTLAIGSKREQGEQEGARGARGSKRGVRGVQEGARGARGSEGSEKEQAGRDPWPDRAGGHPKTCPHKSVETPKHTT